MSYYPKVIADQIAEKCHIFYINRERAAAWNETLRGDELRLLTGYAWEERGGEHRHRCGYKTESAAMRDAYYVLIQHREQPHNVRRPRLRVVKVRAA